MAKLLRPSARQMRSDFEHRAFSGLSGSGTLAGLGLGGRPKMQDERSIGELRKRVAMQEDAICDLQREVLDAGLSREALLQEHGSVELFRSEISSPQFMVDYVCAAELAADSLESEISHGREAVGNLRRISDHEEVDRKFLLAMMGNFRGRVLASIPCSAGILFVPERLPDRKFLDRKSRPPPMSPLDETPEHRLSKSLNRKFLRLANALVPCLWLRQARNSKVAKSALNKFISTNSMPPVLPQRPALADVSLVLASNVTPASVTRPRTTGGVKTASHTASFFATAKRNSPYSATLKAPR